MLELMPYLLVGLKALSFFLCLVFLLSGLDELFIDAVFLLRQAYRKFFILRRVQRLSEEQLLAVPEQAVAIMIPCWDESAVIRKMVANTVKTLNYSNYHIFVGTYPNDEATQREVEIARETYPNVHRIVCPKDGPTNKADCLNWVYEGIKVFEKDNGMRFEIFVMDDSEDILHPLYLKLFNYLIPRKDMVQLPVFPMVAPTWNFTAGHYQDEFAENHAKDMFVREVLSKSVPSAGVGSAYSRRALEALANDNNNQLFNINSLTEDYDIGLRLGKFGYAQIFVRHALRRKTMAKGLLGKAKQVETREYVVIREFFPRTLRTAVRQKSRWVIGIALQGWVIAGWRGGFWTRYMLARDRKALLTNQVNMLGNLLVPVLLGIMLYQDYAPHTYHYPALVEPGSLLWSMVLANTFFLLWRMFWRAVYVGRIYGTIQALLSIPRLFWGNWINFCATWRALHIYAKYLWTGKIIAWDKTAHIYPSEDEMRAYRRRLGDLLLDKRFVTVSQLDTALAEQKKTGRPLGDVLIRKGIIQEDDLVQVLGMQFRLQTKEIDTYAIPLDVLRMVPRELALAHDICPLEVKESGVLVVAVANPPSPEQLRHLEGALGVPVELLLTTKSDLAFALRRSYDRLGQDTDRQAPPLGERLVRAGACSSDQLEQALRKQRRCYSRLGDILLDLQALTRAELDRAVAEYFEDAHKTVKFGDYLVSRGTITQSQLDEALAEQDRCQVFLGDLLADSGVDPAAIRATLSGVEAAA